MSNSPAHRHHDVFARLLGTYADQSEDTPSTEAHASDAPEGDDSIVIPEDFSTLGIDEIESLRQRAKDGFDSIYGDGSDLSEEDLSTLSGLTEGIEALGAEILRREEASRARREQADALAARVSGEHSVERPDEDETEETDADPEDDEEVEEEEQPPTDSTDSAESTAHASGSTDSLATRRKRSEFRVPGLRSSLPDRQTEAAAEQSSLMRANGSGTGFAQGTGIDFNAASEIVEKRLKGFTPSQYENAAARGKHLRQQYSVLTAERPIDSSLQITSSDPAHVEDVLQRATSERNLKGNSLVAAGGWCAPSETYYDMLEVESSDGLFDLPRIGVSRGGINRTLGPDFADIFAQDIGFHYTEDEDIAGDYDGAGGGSKPCYRIECPPFEEFRLEVDGLCISAGLLMQRGYPEVIARTIRGVLVAHEHQMSAYRINEVVAGSDAVTMNAPADAGGAAAPLLSAIELQVEHMRYVRRLSRNTTMEAVFPFWVHGAIRADLAQRTGVDLLSVSNQQIDGWFSARGIRPQFVYNWQDLTGEAGTVTAWPTEAQFLLYPAGTWVAGGENIISLDTLYDSMLLGQNDFTALFTEESWMTLKMGFDSRVVTVPLCVNGMTNSGIAYDCDGAQIAAPAA